jgi:hypothetical protein
VDLDRQSIEKRDFPIGRRGYEPGAVDAHLEAIAAEVAALQRQARSRSGESLASMASAQVQAIVEAAESSAADIERQAQSEVSRFRDQAQSEVSRIRDQAQNEADATREDAIERARDHVGRVSDATAVMLQRVEAMGSELGALFESLRTGSNRLTADLSLLEGNMGELYEASGGRGAAARRRPAPTTLPSQPAEEPEPAFEGASEPAPARLEEAEVPAPAGAEPEAEAAVSGNGDAAPVAPAAAEEGAGAGDAEGARLIALNMALNGQSREEADRYLAENFDLPDRARLLDEVYASVQG